MSNFDGFYEHILVLPEQEWRNQLRENDALVGRLRDHGAAVTPDGVLVVEAERLYRVTLLLREHNLTWRFDPAFAVETALTESDPVTLMNRMLYDPEEPYSWEDRKPLKWYPEGEEIEDAMDDYDKSLPNHADQTLQMPQDGVKASNVAAKALDHGWQDPSLAAVGEGKEGAKKIKNEAGTESTDPDFNTCPAYMEGFCRVDGRVCLYNKETFEDCPKFNTALIITKGNMAIPPGSEDDEDYGGGAFGDKDDPLAGEN